MAENILNESFKIKKLDAKVMIQVFSAPWRLCVENIFGDLKPAKYSQLPYIK